MNNVCINPKVSIIIPTMHGLNLLKETLPPLLSSVSNINFKTEIIIIDNGKDDGTKNWLSSNNYNVIYEYFEKPLGFSKACNIGTQKSRGEYLFFMNNDIKVKGDFLTPLLNIYEKYNKVFAVGPKFLRWDEITLDDCMRNPSFSSGLIDVILDKDNVNNLTPMVFFLGGGFLVLKERFLEFNGFDEIYTPFAWEDLDLGYRACKRGYYNIYCPFVVLMHKREATTKTNFSTIQFKSIVWKNKFIFMWSNLTDKKILFEHIYLLPFKLTKFLFNGRWPYVIGFIKALFQIRKIITKRKYEKQFFILTDQNILDGTWKNKISLKSSLLNDEKLKLMH